MIGLMGGAVVSFRFSVFVHDWFNGGAVVSFRFSVFVHDWFDGGCCGELHIFSVCS